MILLIGLVMTLTDYIKEQKGLLEAAAGHGKTHAIAECVKLCPDDQCQLILTHTHAGIASIKAKMHKLGNDTKKYHIETITSFAQTFVMAYANTDDLPEASDGLYFPMILNKALKVFSNPHILDVVRLSYSGLFVDEYQDCDKSQHAIIMKLAQVLPTHVLGDELQGIFGFAGPLVEFDKDLAGFKKFELLEKPWRWQSDGNCKNLGNKILEYRRVLKSEDKTIKLVTDGSAHVFVYKTSFDLSDNNEDYYSLLRKQTKYYDCDSLLIIYPSYRDEYGNLKGAIHDRVKCKARFDYEHKYILLEAIDDKAFYSNAGNIDSFIRGIMKARKKEKKVYDLLDGLSFKATDLKKWFNDKKSYALISKQGDNKEKSEKLAVIYENLLSHPCKQGIISLINFFMKEVGCRPQRPELVSSILYCLKNYPGKDMTVLESMKEMRNVVRRAGRKILGRCIGTTLLTKGLEFDNVIILDAHRFEDSKNFYVAVSRACKNLIIITKNQTLHFEK